MLRHIAGTLHHKEVVTRSATVRNMAMRASASAPTVLVTGAGGKTGKLVAKKIKESQEYSLRALFRTEEVC
jgi:FlaA1/EpsC-like NDP-sugar epimerase